MKSKAIKTIVITILSIVTLIIIDKILVSNYIYGFFSSMLIGLLLGGICSICIVLILILILIIRESVKEEKSAEESILNRKKIKKIACFVIIIAIFTSSGLSFLSQGDFIRKYRNNEDSCIICSKQAEFCSNQYKNLGYCGEHKSHLLSNIKSNNTKRSGTSSTKDDNGNDWDNYDYDNDGNINQGEWEDALGDYMDDIMGN